MLKSVTKEIVKLFGEVDPFLLSFIQYNQKLKGVGNSCLRIVVFIRIACDFTAH